MNRGGATESHDGATGRYDRKDDEPCDAGLTLRPLHHRILEELRREIRAGDLKPGDALPSEGDLMGRFGVARGTVRQALAALRADGSIIGPRGRPPIVRDRRLAQSFTNLLSFSAWIRTLGMEPSGKLIALTLRPADDETAGMLGVPPASLVYELVRVRYADGEPLLVERSAMPRAVGALVAGLDLERDSIYTELQRRGVTFATAHQIIDALPASAEDARLLGAEIHTPLLRVRRQAFAPDGTALEWSDARYLARRVTFTLDNTAARVGLVRHLDTTAGR
jgi:GntR family transcriptional regulator